MFCDVLLLPLCQTARHNIAQDHHLKCFDSASATMEIRPYFEWKFASAWGCLMAWHRGEYISCGILRPWLRVRGICRNSDTIHRDVRTNRRVTRILPARRSAWLHTHLPRVPGCVPALFCPLHDTWALGTPSAEHVLAWEGTHRESGYWQTQSWMAG